MRKADKICSHIKQKIEVTAIAKSQSPKSDVFFIRVLFQIYVLFLDIFPFSFVMFYLDTFLLSFVLLGFV